MRGLVVAVAALQGSAPRDDVTNKDAERQLNYVRGLRIRLLGDRVLQNVAWKVADRVGVVWPRARLLLGAALCLRAERRERSTATTPTTRAAGLPVA